MPDPFSKYREVGSIVSGYSEQGPFHCEDCIHLQGTLCTHPAVMSDPELADKGTDGGLIVNPEKGCCKYVRPGEIALLLRHGETELNAENKIRSWIDVPLDQNGQKQAVEAANFLLEEYPGIVRVISSPLMRAQQTAQPIADALGLQVEIEQRLVSWHLGLLMGEDRDEYKDVLQHFIENPQESIPEGESLDQVRKRVGEAVDEIFEEAEERGLTLIVTQSSDIFPILQLIEGKDHGQPLETSMTGPGGIIAVSLEGDGYAAEVVFGESKPAEIGAS